MKRIVVRDYEGRIFITDEKKVSYYAPANEIYEDYGLRRVDGDEEKAILSAFDEREEKKNNGECVISDCKTKEYIFYEKKYPTFYIAEVRYTPKYTISVDYEIKEEFKASGYEEAKKKFDKYVIKFPDKEIKLNGRMPDGMWIPCVRVDGEDRYDEEYDDEEYEEED